MEQSSRCRLFRDLRSDSYLLHYCTRTSTVQADLMMKLVARIRDFLTEFLSKYLSVKPIWQEISSFKSPNLQKSC